MCLHELLIGGLISAVERFKAEQIIPCAKLFLWRCLSKKALKSSLQKGNKKTRQWWLPLLTPELTQKRKVERKVGSRMRRVVRQCLAVWALCWMQRQYRALAIFIFIPKNQHKVDDLSFNTSNQLRVLKYNHKTTPAFATSSFLSAAINALFYPSITLVTPWIVLTLRTEKRKDLNNKSYVGVEKKST